MSTRRSHPGRSSYPDADFTYPTKCFLELCNQLTHHLAYSLSVVLPTGLQNCNLCAPVLVFIDWASPRALGLSAQRWVVASSQDSETCMQGFPQHPYPDGLLDLMLPVMGGPNSKGPSGPNVDLLVPILGPK